MSEIINEILENYPAPWQCKLEDNGLFRIWDSTDRTVDSMLTGELARVAVALVNQRHANLKASEAMAGEIEAKFEELRRERDSANVNLNGMIDVCNTAVAQRDNMEVVMLAAQQDKADPRSEMAELNDIISAQRALIDGLQRRLDRLEGRA